MCYRSGVGRKGLILYQWTVPLEHILVDEWCRGCPNQRQEGFKAMEFGVYGGSNAKIALQLQ